MLIVGLITREGMFSTVGGTVPEKIEYLHPSNVDIFVLIIAVMFISALVYFLSKNASPRLMILFFGVVRMLQQYIFSNGL